MRGDSKVVGTMEKAEGIEAGRDVANPDAIGPVVEEDAFGAVDGTGNIRQ